VSSVLVFCSSLMSMEVVMSFVSLSS
jgi:hypothetical protein